MRKILTRHLVVGARTLTRVLGVGALAAGALAAVAAPTGTASAASTCTVAYSVVNNWPGGFQAGHHGHQQRGADHQLGAGLSRLPERVRARPAWPWRAQPA